MTTVWGPADVVAAVIAFLRGFGFPARSRVPIERAPGMVRVQRVGGGPDNESQDVARVLIECWHSTQPESFDYARSLYAAMESVQNQEDIPGLLTYTIDTGFPVQYPDELAPDLDRHQFEVSLRVAMEEVKIPHGDVETPSP